MKKKSLIKYSPEGFLHQQVEPFMKQLFPYKTLAQNFHSTVGHFFSFLGSRKLISGVEKWSPSHSSGCCRPGLCSFPDSRVGMISGKKWKSAENCWKKHKLVLWLGFWKRGIGSSFLMGLVTTIELCRAFWKSQNRDLLYVKKFVLISGAQGLPLLMIDRLRNCNK